MDQLLVDITHAFEPRYRTSKITKLFTIDGDEVFKVDELVESKDSAVSENECLCCSFPVAVLLPVLLASLLPSAILNVRGR